MTSQEELLEGGRSTGEGRDASESVAGGEQPVPMVSCWCGPESLSQLSEMMPDVIKGQSTQGLAA